MMRLALAAAVAAVLASAPAAATARRSAGGRAAGSGAAGATPTFAAIPVEIPGPQSTLLLAQVDIASGVQHTVASLPIPKDAKVPSTCKVPTWRWGGDLKVGLPGAYFAVYYIACNTPISGTFATYLVSYDSATREARATSVKGLAPQENLMHLQYDDHLGAVRCLYGSTPWPDVRGCFLDLVSGTVIKDVYKLHGNAFAWQYNFLSATYDTDTGTGWAAFSGDGGGWNNIISWPLWGDDATRGNVTHHMIDWVYKTNTQYNFYNIIYSGRPGHLYATMGTPAHEYSFAWLEIAPAGGSDVAVSLLPGADATVSSLQQFAYSMAVNKAAELAYTVGCGFSATSTGCHLLQYDATKQLVTNVTKIQNNWGCLALI